MNSRRVVEESLEAFRGNLAVAMGTGCLGDGVPAAPPRWWVLVWWWVVDLLGVLAEVLLFVVSVVLVVAVVLVLVVVGAYAAGLGWNLAGG